MKKAERYLAFLTMFCLLLCAIIPTGLASGTNGEAMNVEPNSLVEGTLTVTPSFTTIYVLDEAFAALNMTAQEFENRTQRQTETEVRTSFLAPGESVTDWQVSDPNIANLRIETNKYELIAKKPGTVTVTAVTNTGRSGSVEVTVKLLESFAIDQSHFPDDAFRDYLLHYYGDYIVGDNLVSRDRIESLTHFAGYYDANGNYIWFHKLKYSSLQGIEHFSNLESLPLSNNNLTSLDVSQNKKLKTLYVDLNSLTSLNVSGCDALEVLWCGNNDLSSLDVSNCPNLYILQCDFNPMTSLDVTHCPRLKVLYASRVRLTSLDVSQCPDLLELYVDDTSISISPPAKPFRTLS